MRRLINETQGEMGIYIALIHYPVMDKHGRAVATAITNLDIHDLARVARTYNVSRFYVVNPIPSQQWLANRVIQHWLEGYGAEYNPTRQEAVKLASVVADLEEVIEDIGKDNDLPVVFVATTAKPLPHRISFKELREKIYKTPANYCILFGTGWGLHPSLILDVDYVLEPIRGVGDFAHLSVRSAAGIILDRLIYPDKSP